MLVPPQSLQTLLLRLCSQMLAPPQFLHLFLKRLCSQMLARLFLQQVCADACVGSRIRYNACVRRSASVA
jgi:hypothetical protein